MKVNDTRTLSQPSAFGSLGQVPDAAVSKPDAEATPQPAAKIDLSQQAQDARAATSAAADMDHSLIEEIRQRIQNGTFKMDHTQISQNLLRDALLATRR